MSRYVQKCPDMASYGHLGPVRSDLHRKTRPKPISVWGLAWLRAWHLVSHPVYDLPWSHPTCFPFFILDIFVRIAESNHLHARRNRDQGRA
jgi:hypothetical protein